MLEPSHSVHSHGTVQSMYIALDPLLNMVMIWLTKRSEFTSISLSGM
jgi:hypothetical protein